MPNWVANTVGILGRKDEVANIKARLNRSYSLPYINVFKDEGLKYNLMVNNIFSFWNIVSPIDQGIDLLTYASQPPSLDIKADLNTDEWHTEFHKKYLEQSKVDNTWYNWNVRNWGCKWDATDVELNHENTYVVNYKFNTPWSPPIPAISELSKLVPHCTVILEYEEETGWGGEITFSRGTAIAQSEYENKCWFCYHTDCSEYCSTCSDMVCNKCGNNALISDCPKHSNMTYTSPKRGMSEDEYRDQKFEESNHFENII